MPFGQAVGQGFVNPGFVVASVVVIEGTTGGLFVYNGIPGPGNPPVFAVVAPGVTSDPYGNPVEAVMNAGNISGAHFGLDDAGNAYLADPSGSTRIYISPALTGMFFYTAATASVLMSLAGSAGTEPLTHSSFPAGFVLRGTNGSYVWITVQGGVATAAFSGGATDELNAGRISTGIIGTSPYFEETVLIGPQFNAPANDYVYVGLQSAASDNSGRAGGNLYYVDVTGFPLAILQWGAGGIFATNIKDQNNYDVQRKTFFASGQLINGTSFTGLSGIQAISVGAQTYRLHGKLLMQTINAGAAILAFAGPALSSGEISWTINDVANGVGAVNLYAWRTVSTLNGITSPAFAANHLWTVNIDGQLTFSTAAASSFGILAAVAAAGQSYDVLAGSHLDMMPVTV